MNALKALLFVPWIVLVGITLHAVRSPGSAGVAVFFSDFLHPWRRPKRAGATGWIAPDLSSLDDIIRMLLGGGQ